jgi:CopG family nickel-responsive transcriptional regulator
MAKITKRPAGTPRKKAKQLVSRISMSLSEDLVTELDAMVAKRGFANRSQAVAKILHRSLVEHRNEVGGGIMFGTITLFYDENAAGVRHRLAALQRRHIDEVISSVHVLLDGERTLEVVLVQGPPPKVQMVADSMITQRGVIWGRLELVGAIIPQLHPFPNSSDKKPQ